MEDVVLIVFLTKQLFFYHWSVFGSLAILAYLHHYHVSNVDSGARSDVAVSLLNVMKIFSPDTPRFPKKFHFRA